MINNGIGYIKLREGGYLKLDVEDYLLFKDIDWRILKKESGNIFFVAKKPDGKHAMFLHRAMGVFDEERDKNKQIHFLNGDQFDYRRFNIHFRHYPVSKGGGKKQKHHNRLKMYKGRLSLEGFIIGIVANKAIIAVDNERDLVCAVCSNFSNDEYMACLDYAAIEQWPGWKCLGGPHCDYLRSLMDESFGVERVKMVAA